MYKRKEKNNKNFSNTSFTNNKNNKKISTPYYYYSKCINKQKVNNENEREEDDIFKEALKIQHLPKKELEISDITSIKPYIPSKRRLSQNSNITNSILDTQEKTSDKVTSDNTSCSYMSGINSIIKPYDISEQFSFSYRSLSRKGSFESNIHIDNQNASNIENVFFVPKTFTPIYSLYMKQNEIKSSQINNNINKIVTKTKINKCCEPRAIENTDVLVINLKISKDKILIFKIRRYDDMFQTVKMFCEINNLDTKLIRPIIQYIIKAMNSIYGIYNLKLKNDEIKYLMELKNESLYINNKNI